MKWLTLLALLLTGCGNYEEFKESFEAGFANIGPTQDLNFDFIKSQVLAPRCTTCHSKYGVYENVKNNINAIVGMVRADVMPKDGPLTNEQKGLLFSWVEAGMPEFSTVANPPSNPNPTPDPDPTPPTPTPLPPEDRLTFSNVYNKVFEPHCLRCHGNFNDYATVESKITPIVNMVRSDIMPMGSTLPVDLKTLLFEWAAAGAPQDSTGPTNPPGPQPPQPLPLAPNYESLNQHVFSQKCIGCHNPSGRASFIDLSSYEAIKANSWLFDFRRPERSEIIDEITDDEEPMPPLSSPFAQVTRQEVQTLIQWIRLRIPKN